jgi:hypothetical protein
VPVNAAHERVGHCWLDSAWPGVLHVISTCPALGLRAWLVVWGDVLVTLVTGTAATDRQFKGDSGGHA